MNSLKSRFKVLWILAPLLVLFLGLDLNSGNPTEPSVISQDTQKKMTKADFDKLPDDHVFTIKERKVTKAQILARLNKMRSSYRPIGKKITPAELKAMSVREHQAMVKKDNLKIQEHMKIQLKSKRPLKMVASSRPRITSTFSVPPLSPDEDIYIKGSGFKDNNLKVKLLGNFPNGFASLRVLDLKPNNIRARVSDVSGAPDQPAKLVVSVDGVESNQWPTTFEARREIRHLAAKDYNVLFCHPGLPRSSDTCNEHASGPGLESSIFSSSHSYGSLETGTDIVVAELKNGWYFKDLAYLQWWQAHPVYGQNAQYAWVNGFKPNTERMELKIGWIYVGSGGIHYHLGVSITGPAGIPYN
jgi:hypothetical protein